MSMQFRLSTKINIIMSTLHTPCTIGALEVSHDPCYRIKGHTNCQLSFQNYWFIYKIAHHVKQNSPNKKNLHTTSKTSQNERPQIQPRILKSIISKNCCFKSILTSWEHNNELNEKPYLKSRILRPWTSNTPSAPFTKAKAKLSENSSCAPSAPSSTVQELLRINNKEITTLESHQK